MISERTERWLTWLLVGSLFVYVVLRAVLVPITYDEAATFFHYIRVGQYWPGVAHWDANNHILNSFLSICSYRTFGVDEIWLRLPNVLAGALYLFMTVKLSSLLSSKWLKWMLILGLCGNHFMLEFFSVTRGYGLSMALLLSALYPLYQWAEKGKPILLATALVLMQLATLANLSLLIANLLLVSGATLWLLWKHRDRLVLSIAPLLLSAFCIKWFVELSFEYKERGLLYYGSGKGFWESTIASLAEFGFPAVEAVFPAASMLALMILMVVCIYYVLRKGVGRALLFGYLFWGCALAIVLMHHLLEVNYPEDRVAMHFLVLFPFALIFLLDGIESKPIRLIAPIVLLIFPVNMLLSANLAHVRLWKVDACAKEFYEEVRRYSESTGEAPTIAGYRLRDIPLYYYGFKNNAPVTVIQDVAYQGNEADLQYAFLVEDGKWNDYQVLKYNKAADLHLLKRKKERKQVTWDEKTTPAREVSIEPYFPFYESEIDSMVGKDLLWEVEVQMPELSEPFRSWVTTVISTEKHETLMQETVVVDWLQPTWQEGELLQQKILMANIPEGAKRIKIFFWNIEEKPIALGKTHVKLIELKE